MLVRDFMVPNPHVVDSKTKLADAIYLFYKYKLEALPVVDPEKKLCGLITRTDLLHTMVNHLSPSIGVEFVMTKSVVTVHPDNTLEEAWQIPLSNLPVVSYEDRVIGLVNRQDFIQIFYNQLREQENRVKQISELSYSGVICINLYGIITQINDMATQLLKISKDSAEGRFIYDLVPQTRLMEVIHTGRTEKDVEINIDGQKLLVNRAPVCEGYKVVGAVAIIQNVVADTAADEYKQTREKMEMFEQVLASLKQGLIIVDTENIIRFVNNAYEELMGIPREKLLNANAEKAVENSRLHIVLKTGIPELDATQLVNGRKVIADRVPFFKNGKVAGAIGEAIFKDISDVEQLLARNKKLMEENPANKRVKVQALQPQMVSFENIIGQSAVMIKLKNLAAKVAAMDTTVLIQGESGTGKDLFAQAIHNASNRRSGAFVAINCAAIPADLLESELFGYVEGAFTGARKGGKKGKFELADGGTLFLDEIGDMPMVMQAKLLRVMQNKTFEHVGGEHVQVCNVRFIAATNKDLLQLVEQGDFREDLYYRLNVVCLKVPPLRQRKEDIREIIEMMMPVICNNLKITLKRIDESAMEKLMMYKWPGNIRELINVLEQQAATISHMTITEKDLPLSVLQSRLDEKKMQDDEGNEEAVLKSVLEKAHGNKVLAAKLLGIHRSTLYGKLKKYALK